MATYSIVCHCLVGNSYFSNFYLFYPTFFPYYVLDLIYSLWLQNENVLYCREKASKISQEDE